jgi:hypothetical protein
MLSLVTTHPERCLMKNIVAQFSLSASKIQKHHIQLFIFILTVALLVLGAGAPADGGGISH